MLQCSHGYGSIKQYRGSLHGVEHTLDVEEMLRADPPVPLGALVDSVQILPDLRERDLELVAPTVGPLAAAPAGEPSQHPQQQHIGPQHQVGNPGQASVDEPNAQPADDDQQQQGQAYDGVPPDLVADVLRAAVGIVAEEDPVQLFYRRHVVASGQQLGVGVTGQRGQEFGVERARLQEPPAITVGPHNEGMGLQFLQGNLLVVGLVNPVLPEVVLDLPLLFLLLLQLHALPFQLQIEYPLPYGQTDYLADLPHPVNVGLLLDQFQLGDHRVLAFGPGHVVQLLHHLIECLHEVILDVLQVGGGVQMVEGLGAGVQLLVGLHLGLLLLATEADILHWVVAA